MMYQLIQIYNEILTKDGANIDILINENIEVSWTDIVEEVDNSIVEPLPENLEKYEYYKNSYYSGQVVYKDQEYTYDNGTKYSVYETFYDRVIMLILQSDCGEWNNYAYQYNC